MVGPERHVVAIVDDDSEVRESLVSLVESAGYDVMSFWSAENFIQSGRLAEASCLIVDVRMPGMGGLELQRRARLDRPELPIIFITGHHDENVRQRALQRSVQFVFYKPLNADDLLGAIGSVLYRSGEKG